MPFKNQHPLYTVWQGALNRCRNPNNKQWADYGGRGIYVCKRWRESFHAFLEDMGEKPSKKHTLERMDNDGPYSPDNCHWATRKEQQQNRRANRLIQFNGETLPVTVWARRISVKPDTVWKRLASGYPLDVALTHHRIPESMVRAKRRSESQCKAGHPVNDENTYRTKQGWRVCRVCRNERLRGLRSIPPTKRELMTVEIGGSAYRVSELAKLADVGWNTIMQRVAKGLSYDEVIGSCTLPEPDPKFVELAKRLNTPRPPRTHCMKGHEYTPDNIVYKRNGNKLHRQCRICKEASDEAYRAKHRKGFRTPKTHCKRGHEFTAENTLIDSHGGRQCRACEKIRAKAKAERRKKRLTSQP